jgi:Holliday junction resolvasome RuvABC endonuclease subunit
MDGVKVKNYRDGKIEGPVAIGIDPSLTGFAVCAIDKNGNWEAQVFSPTKLRGPERLYTLTLLLADFLNSFESIDDIAIEGTVRMSASASVLGELTGAVKCLLFGSFGLITPLNVPPMTLKVYANGSGKSTSKSQILLSCYKKWDAEFDDDNAADSYVLARIAAGMHNTDYEEKALDRLNDLKFRL